MDDQNSCSSEYIQISTTVNNRDQGKIIANALMENRLAACVQIVENVTSIYPWKGKINTERELLLLIKSKSSIFSKIRDLIEEIHPYEIPEIIATPIFDGNISYFKWLNEQING